MTWQLHTDIVMAVRFWHCYDCLILTSGQFVQTSDIRGILVSPLLATAKLFCTNTGIEGMDTYVATIGDCLVSELDAATRLVAHLCNSLTYLITCMIGFTGYLSLLEFIFFLLLLEVFYGQARLPHVFIISFAPCFCFLHSIWRDDPFPLLCCSWSFT